MMNRYRRLRSNPEIRQLVQETQILKQDLIYPLFVIEGKNKKEEIVSMPNVYRLSIDLLLKEIESYMKLGGVAGLLFGVPKQKDPQAREALNPTGLTAKTITTIKKNFPQFFLITDVCLCAYMSHGHCGIVKNNQILNDETLPFLSSMALVHAQSGADMLAPSDMMDGRVKHIRDTLDKNKFSSLPIMAYSVKYASSFYGPFREALSSSPTFGDRKTYQMDFANIKEALSEAKQDVWEGADIIMVKPALAYLDIIYRLSQELTVPLAAYQVSGEYSLIKAAAKQQWIDEKSVVLETLTAIKRAGAKLMITYYAKDILKWL